MFPFLLTASSWPTGVEAQSISTFNAFSLVSRSLAEACSEGDVNAVRKLLIEGRSVNEHTEEGESLLCLACSAGYYELAQVGFLAVCTVCVLNKKKC